MSDTPEITQITSAIIAECKRITQRLDPQGVEYPVIGIKDVDHWTGGHDVAGMLRTINSLTAVRVIYAGAKSEPLKVIGGGSAHDETMLFRLALVVTDLSKGAGGSQAGYASLEALAKCFTKFALTPLRGFLWKTSDDLLLVDNGKYVYGIELERRINR